MPASAGRDTRRRRVLVLVGLAIIAYAATSSGAPVVPVPDPIVIVHTESGGVVRDTPVPIGGLPVSIDVDSADGRSPDIDVALRLVAISELPDDVLVPNLEVKRNLLAVERGAAAPPLKLNARIVLRDASTASRLATVDYGFETPPGARMPPLVRTKLVGPPAGGFIDPLVARIETPGYEGPLDIHANVLTKTFEGRFGLNFDPLPDDVVVTADPQEKGLDIGYEHVGRTPDVKLDATANLRDVASNRLRRLRATVERLPNSILLAHRSSGEETSLEYRASSELGKPDVQAGYSDTLGNGTIVADADVKLAGLPSHVRGVVATRPTTGGGTDIDGVRVEVLDGGEIDAVDFVARNWEGTPHPVPMHTLGADHSLSMASRRQADGGSRFRMAGRLLGVREVGYVRSGPERDNLLVTSDVGDGKRPLRAILDIDDRAATPKKGQKRHFVDTTVSKLSSRLDVLYEPATKTTPLHLLYKSTSAVDVDTRTVIAEGAADGCGEDRVVCADASIDRLPPVMDVKVPGKGGTDFSVSHTGDAATRPNVRATVDLGPDSSDDPPSERRWLRATLEGIPNEVRGRMDTNTGELRAAEFHGCRYDFDAGECDGPQGAIDAVRFTVRDQPSRAGLPPRPDVARQHVTLVSRQTVDTPKRFEVTGRVDEVRNVAFRQLDLVKGDGKTDGVLGAEVDVGTGGEPFDVVVDEVGVARDEDSNAVPKPVLGEEINEVGVRVDPLPARFSTCVRSSKEVAPPDPSSLPADPLLAQCQRTDVVEPEDDEHPVTPLTAHYSATDADGGPALPDVTAHVRTTKPDTDDLDDSPQRKPIPNTTRLELGVDDMPATLDVDVIPPITPDATKQPKVEARKLVAKYRASSPIPVIGFELERRRATSVCEDPRPRRKALCVSATLTNLPAEITTEYDPDDASGLIDITSTPPAENQPKLSILPLHLSKVSPEDAAKPLVLDASIVGITPHLRGHIQSLELDGESPPGALRLSEQLATCSNENANGTPKDDDLDGEANAKDDDCERDPARLDFDACPDDGACTGIDSIQFEATDQLVADPQPQTGGGGGAVGGHVPVVPPTPDVGTQGFSFVQSGEFRASGEIRNFKRLAYDKVDRDGKPSRVTHISAGLGNAGPLKLLVDRDTGSKREKLDAVVTNAPKTIDVCMREPSHPDDLRPASDDFCETSEPHQRLGAVGDKLAMQVKLERASGGLPDIDVRRFEFSKGGGTEVLAGSLKVEKLAERIDILQGKGAETELLVEGHAAGDPVRGAPPSRSPVAERITFSVRNFRDLAGLNGYPWDPLDAGTLSPKDDGRNAGNYLQLVKSHDSVLAQGSVPGLRSIEVTPRPCEEDRNRTPALSDFPGLKPEYKCLRTQVAEGRPLGIAVRTLKASGAVLEALSLEEGHISRMPEGPEPGDALEVTIAKSPASHADLPRCADLARFPNRPFRGCRPPVLSLETPPRGASTPESMFEARLATGGLDDIEALRDSVTPDDVLSRRIAFEEPPRTWGTHSTPAPPEHEPDAGQPVTGARVKVGANAQTGETALRLGARMVLPRFLDLDPLTQFECTTLIESPGVPADDCGGDQERQVGKELNDGYASRDIQFRLVAADDDHYGNPVAGRPHLGRVALLVETLAAKTPKTQIVLAGMPRPDGRAPIRETPTTGASSRTPESLPPADHPSEKGFLAPAHLDAEVYLRDDFNAVEDGRHQIKYAQIDGRVNVPLSMAMRLNDREPVTAEALERYVGSSNRAGDRVSSTQVVVRNAAGSNNSDPGDGYANDGYLDPTFRVRAELRAGFQNAEPGVGDSIKDFFFCGGELTGPACLVLPTGAKTRYLDVGINGDPLSDGLTTTTGAARTIDAVGGPFGGSNDIDLRGFREVRPPGDKGPRAAVTTTAVTRLTNFNLGFGLNAGGDFLGGTLTYEMLGDLLLGLASDATERTRLSHNKLQARVRSEGGATRVMTDLDARNALKLVVRAFWQSITLLNLRTHKFAQPVVFHTCSGDGSSGENLLSTTSEIKASFSLGFSNIFGVTNQPINALSTLVAPFGCLDSIGITDFATSSAPLVSTDNGLARPMRSPAPAYSVPGHPVPDQDPATPGDPPDVRPLPAPDPVADFMVPSGAMTLCGTHRFRHLTVKGSLRVGAPGETHGGEACDGTLNIDADSIAIEAGGTIDAAGIVSGGAGQPAAGAGGGAGHRMPGGASGAEEAQAGQGPGGEPYDPPAAGLSADLGSQGRPGAGPVAGGKGGGAITLAADVFSHSGTITADGAPGGDAAVQTGGACLTGGGGGSGGAVVITTDHVQGTGTISARGGKGGDGGFGGGGGSGGRVRLNAVASDKVADDTTAEKNKAADLRGGEGAGGSGFCDTPADTQPRFSGQPGGDGRPSMIGPTLISYVRFADPSLGVYTDSQPEIDAIVIAREAGLGAELVVCRRKALFSDPDAFGLATDPAGSSSVAALRQGALCFDPVPLTGAPNSHVDGTRTLGLTGTGVWGFFSYVRQARCPEDYEFGVPEWPPNMEPGDNPATCWKVNDTPGKPPKRAAPDFTLQDPLPSVSVAKVGVDLQDPAIHGLDGAGLKDGCPGPNGTAICLTERHGELSVSTADTPTPQDEPGSGLRSVTCQVTPWGQASDPPLDCATRPTVLALQEGLSQVTATVSDRAGRTRSTEVHQRARWFVDTQKPVTPTLTLEFPDAAVNGWHREFPTVTAKTSDPGPSSGFRSSAGGTPVVTSDAITLFVDEGKKPCSGEAHAGSRERSVHPQAECAVDLAGIAEGEHRVTAVATDFTGHTSKLSDGEDMKVDSLPPASRLTIGPRRPDGRGGWYRSKPFIAFSASDGPGGSGVRPELDADGVKTGIWVSLDPELPSKEPFALYDPDAPIVLGDGKHEVCWYAVDLAGNREDADPAANGFQPHCQDDIRVDSTAPVTDHAITPSAPDGSNGFYLTRPEVAVSGDDPQTAVPFSGLDRVEYQVDDGPWVAAAPFRIDEGRHDVRVRAFDNAGNASELREFTVHVDLTRPEVGLTTYPPAPNTQGWFRQPRVHTVTAHDARGGSGPDSATYAMDGGQDQPFGEPFAVGPVTHAVTAVSRDRAGLLSARTDPPVTSRIDLGRPTARPSRTPPGPVSTGLLSPATSTRLHFTVGDDLADRLKVTVFVLGIAGQYVRRIAVEGPLPGGWSPAGDGSVVWDGLNHGGKTVLPGIYHFRVQAVDRAGNSVTSTESPVFPVVLGLP